MEDWAALELAPWRGVRLSRSGLHDGLRSAAGRDPSIALFTIAGGRVSVVADYAHLPAIKGEFFRDQAALFAAFLQQVVERHGVDCDLPIGVRMEDRGADEWAAPLFCFHKLRYERNILLPDLNFFSCGFYEAASFRDDLPFAAKRPHAYFVGATTDGIVTMDRVRSGGHPRIRAARFFCDRPEVTFEISRVVQCDDAETQAAVEAMVPMAPGPRSWADQFAYRYLLSLDGNGATWSRTAVALASASVLVRYGSPYLLYYFHGLEPWTHYIPVRHDRQVVDLVAAAARNVERDARIAEAGRRFAATHLNRDAVMRYMAALLAGYAGLVRAG